MYVQNYGREMSYLAYYSLISAIPKQWKADIKNQSLSSPTGTENYNFVKMLDTAQRASTLAYQQLQNKVEIQDVASSKWASILDITWQDSEWKKIRVSAHKISIAVKLKDFQYRLLSYKLVTNVLRNKWNEQILADCTYCKKER